MAEVMLEEGYKHPSFLDKGHVWHREAKITGTYPYFFVVARGGAIALRQSGKLAEGNAAFERIESAIKQALDAKP
ncbi:MAG TPA: hypothetical protein VH560_01250 [Polyangia bacterium]|nr:hypothetical protein [Polyangia bacterium]